MHTEVLHGAPAQLSISGSAGMGLADACGVPFVQEAVSYTHLFEETDG